MEYSSRRQRAFWEANWGKEDYSTVAFGKVVKRTDVRNKFVLDLGCGIRRFSSEIDNEAGKTVCVDISSTALKYARRREGVGVCMQADMCELPFASGSFDVVLSFQTVSGLGENTFKALSEASRVLKPGGRMLFDLEHKDIWLSDGRMPVVNGHCFLIPFEDGISLAVHDKKDVQRILSEIGMVPEEIKVYAQGGKENRREGKPYPSLMQNRSSIITVRAVRES